MDELMNENVIYNVYQIYLFTEYMRVYVCIQVCEYICHGMRIDARRFFPFIK